MVAHEQAGIADLASAIFEAIKAKTALYPQIKGCLFEREPEEGQELPCLVVRMLEGDPAARRYLDGHTLGRFAFACELYERAGDDAARLSARETLSLLAVDLAGQGMHLGSDGPVANVRLTGAPTAQLLESGATAWKVTLEIHYLVQR